MNNKVCKITVMSDGAFAINGILDVLNVNDNTIAWDGTTLGKKEYLKHLGNIYDAATEWAEVSAKFWTPYFTNQVKDGEAYMKRHSIVVADYDVAGFFHNHPRVMIGSVQVDPAKVRPLQPKPVVSILDPQAEPYSSNTNTEELIAGKTDRAKAVVADWLPKLNTIKESDRNWRTLEYLIQQTAKFDPGVNGRVNVLEITANQKPHWLQNLTCK
jgi:hypothetical protein